MRAWVYVCGYVNLWYEKTVRQYHMHLKMRLFAEKSEIIFLKRAS